MVLTFPLGQTVVFVDPDDPATTDDAVTLGVRKGYWWLNSSSNTAHICVDPTENSAVWQEMALATRAITVGSGLTGGGTLTSDISITLTSTGVVAGSFGSGTAVPVLTVNEYGQITSATTSSITTTGIGAVPTSRTVTVGSGLTGGGTLSSNITIDLDTVLSAVAQNTAGVGTEVLELGRIFEFGKAAFNDTTNVGIFSLTIDASYQIVPQDFRRLIITTASTNNWTLPLASDLPAGWFCLFKNRSGNNLTFTCSGSDTANAGVTVVTVATASPIGFVVRTDSTTFEVG